MSFHRYQIREVFSGADGSLQFIELAVGADDNEDQWAGHVFQVAQGGAVVSAFTVPGDLPSSLTANTSVLLATQAFVDATGLAADFIIPEDFLPTTGGTVTVSFVGADAVTYAASALPTNGWQSLVRTSGSVLTSIVSGQPQNFAGASVTLQSGNHPPSGTAVVTGTPTEDEVLAADAGTVQDADGLGEFSYQWLRGDAAIAGATGATYALGDADVGWAIRVRITYLDDAGTVESLASAPTAAVANVNDGPAGAVEVDGMPVVGSTLVANTEALADDDGLGAFGYQWLRNGSPIGDAAAATYLLVAADAGAAISVRVSYQDGAGTPEQVTSAATAAVATEVNVVEGTPGADELTGTSGPDVIRGFAGNDTLAGGGGEDQLDGGDGIDTAVLGVPLAGVQHASVGNSQLEVQTSAGRIVMDGMERVQLTDLLVAFDTGAGESVWNAEALLWAVLDGAPSQAMLSDWVSRSDNLGGSLAALAQALLDLYAPGISSEALVAYLFVTLLHVTPTQDEVAQFAGLIGTGEPFEDNAAFLAFAAAHEVNTSRFAGFAGSIQVLDPTFF